MGNNFQFICAKNIMSSNTSEDELNMSGGLKNLMNAKTKSATKAQTSKAAN